jgi:monoamine oxidase
MDKAEPIDRKGAERGRWDAVIVGAGHNALVAGIFLARSGLRVLMVEARSMVGGAARTERPFQKAPNLPTSTGAYRADADPARSALLPTHDLGTLPAARLGRGAGRPELP